MVRHRPVGVGEGRADGRWFRRSDERWYDGWSSWGAKWWWWKSSPKGVRNAANGEVENNNTDAGSSVYTVAATEGQRTSTPGITGGHRYSTTTYSHATTGTILEMTEPPNSYHHQQQQHHRHHHHLHQQEQQIKNHNHHQLHRREGNISSTSRSFGSDSDNSSDSGNGPVAANDGTRFSKFITSIKYAFGSHNATNGGPRTDDQNIEPNSSSSSSSNSSSRPLVIKFTTNRSSTVAAGDENTGEDRASKRTGARRNRNSSSSLMNGFKIL